MHKPRILCLLTSVCVALAPAALAAETPPRPAFDACTEPKLPEPNSVQAIEITRHVASGVAKVLSANLYGLRTPEGTISMLVRPTRPEELRGTFLSMRERKMETEILFGSPELETPKRITGADALGRLFNTDFSYEDFAYWNGFTVPADRKRLPDGALAGRAVYIVEITPKSAQDSAYQRIVASVDQETCVPLRSEMYEPGEKLRKVLTVDPESVIHSKAAKRYLPQKVTLADERDGTKTEIEVLSADFDVPGTFNVIGKPPSPPPPR